MSSSQPLTYLDLAEGIIVSLGTIYGNLFTSQWPDSKARERTVRVWASAIEEANLTPDSIKSGPEDVQSGMPEATFSSRVSEAVWVECEKHGYP